jgi:Spy/CpxP family protein refolding chaperone
MFKKLCVVLVPVVVLAIAIPVAAQEKAKRGQGKRAGEKGGRQTQVLPQQLLEGLELTAEQKLKLEAIAKEMTVPMQEARKMVDAILTDEQKAARKEATAAAKEAGKKPREAQQAVEAALKLTADQQAKMAKAKEKMAEVQKQVRDRVMGVLTPEQRQAVEAKMAKGRGGRAKQGDGEKKPGGKGKGGKGKKAGAE